MAEFVNPICQALHREHEATIALVERVARLLAVRGAIPPDAGDAAAMRLLSDLAAGVTTEVGRHFDFEERCLFGYLDGIGESGIGADLTGEHDVLRPVLARLAVLAREGIGAGFDQGGWDEFRRLGRETCGLLPAHIDKEENALLPLIEESMDAQTAARLCQEYMESA